MWTSKNRARYDRSKLRYPSDVLPSLVVPHAGPAQPFIRNVGRRRDEDSQALRHSTPRGMMHIFAQRPNLRNGCVH